MKTKIVILLLLLTLLGNYSIPQIRDEQGMYFSKKVYQQHPLPKYEKMKSVLPNPIFDEKPLWVEAYWKTWEIAFKNFHEPSAGSGFVSQFIDAAFNANIFLWDTAFMTMFLNIADTLTPGISSLDNFYIKQHPSGEICREINRTTGIDFEPWENKEDDPLFSRWGFNDYSDQKTVEIIYKGRSAPVPNPSLTLDALNHPILAWAELESYKWTGDIERLKIVRVPLIKYYEALKKYLRQGNGLYVTDWASMDNSPRNICLTRGGTGIDISSEMVLFARNLSEISAILGRDTEAKQFNEDADQLAEIINNKMWNDDKKFYFDLTLDQTFCPIKTIAAFWTLISKVATQDRAEILVKQLTNPKTFGRLHPVPTLAADEKGFFPQGGYWSGAVWIATNTMVIRGLEEYGYSELAEEIALKHIDAMAQVYRRTGTIWENYSADSIMEGNHQDGASVVKDMVGFSGVTPILTLIELGIGLKPDASKNELIWKINSSQRSGCERFRFNGHLIDLVAESNLDSLNVTVKSDGEFLLKIIRNSNEQEFKVQKGINRFQLR